MLAMAIDQGRHRSAADHVDAAADQGKTLIGEIDHARSVRNAAIEPGLDGVAVGRCDIDGLRCHQRAHMTGDDHVRGGVGRAGMQHKPGRAARQEYREHDRGGERAPRRMRQRTRIFTPQAKRVLDPARQARRCRLARQLLPDGTAQRLDTIPLGRQRGIAGKLPLHFERMGRVELAVDIGVNEQAWIRR
jgi:hypothetical protein